ncbi:GHKL domain-containing protein [Desulfovibrio sp. OttesenSCG-928-G11]|nr:GHKL domain-containing protein [Desulfovibrio sp. OttesenSCG-928-G11]
MIFHVLIQLLILTNSLCHMALLNPRRSRLSIIAGIALIGLPWLARPFLPGGEGHIFGLPAIMLLFSIYAAYICHRFIVENNFAETLFTSFVIQSYMQALFAAFYLGLVLAGFQTGGESMVTARLAYAALTLALLPLFRKFLKAPYTRLLSAAVRQKYYVIFPMQISFHFLGYCSVSITMFYSGAMGLAVCVAGILAVVSFYGALYMFVTREQEYLVLQNRLQASRQLEQTYAFYDKALKEKEERLRVLRHDFRHFLHSLDRQSGQAPEEFIAAYRGKFDALEENAPDILCQNQTVNAVVSYFFDRARQNGTVLSAKLQAPPETDVAEEDLAALLGNALENCVKATSPLGGMGYIKIYIKAEQGYLVCRFVNNYRKGAYETGERVGLASMEQLCAKREGRLEIRDDGQEYQLTAIL